MIELTFSSLFPQFLTFSLVYGSKKRTFVYQDKGAFFELSVPLTRNVIRTSCVMFPLEVMCASRVGSYKANIISLKP